jgi:hypothetical protein
MKLTVTLEPGLAISGDLYSQRGHSTYVSSVTRPESARLYSDSTELYHSGAACLDWWKLAQSFAVQDITCLALESVSQRDKTASCGRFVSFPAMTLISSFMGETSEISPRSLHCCRASDVPCMK